MRRMPFNVEILDLISKYMIYNPETKTMELGVNVEIDGNVQVNGNTEMQLLFDGEIIDSTAGDRGFGQVYVLPLRRENDDNFQYGIIYMNYNASFKFIGVGYWDITDKTFESDGLSDQGDFLIHLSAGITNGKLNIMYNNYQQKTNYYIHELEITFADDTKAYLLYPSLNNLVIDSLQDLTNVVLPTSNTKLGYGSGYIYRDGQVWKNNAGTLITSVSDNVEVID